MRAAWKHLTVTRFPLAALFAVPLPVCSADGGLGGSQSFRDGGTSAPLLACCLNVPARLSRVCCANVCCVRELAPTDAPVVPVLG